MTSSRASWFVCVVVLAMAAVAAMAATARGDTIWVTGASGGGNAMEMGGVQIEKIQDGRLMYATAGGGGNAKDVRQIARVAADNEPALNAAEEALAKNLPDVATDQYRKALASSTKEWVKVWAAQRLTQAAPRANRFDAAASGYIFLLVREPGRAADFKPALPTAQSTFLTSAINEATNALATPSLAPAAKEALQAFIAELQAARAAAAPAGAPAAQAATGAQAVQPSAAQPTAVAPGAGAGAGAGAGQAPQAGSVAAAASADAAVAANQKLAREKLAAVSAALERKDFPGAITEIKASSKIFTEGRDQAQALYFIAEAQTGIARAKNDAAAWQDAALAYMRVVAHFQEFESARPFVARSMLKAAQIQETAQIKDPAAARTLYEQLIAQFPADPAAAEAKAALERLKAKP